MSDTQIASREPERPRSRLESFPLKKLKPKHELMVQYMVFGCEHASICSRIGVPVNTPLSLADAARLVNVRQRHARRLAGHQLFQKAILKACGELRSMHLPAAINRQIELMTETSEEPTAADRKVNLAATALVTGQASSGGASINVNVAVHNTPGYVIDLSEPQPRIIEGSAA